MRSVYILRPGFITFVSKWCKSKFALPSEYAVELEQVIKDETSGDFTKALLAMLSAKKKESTEVDSELAKNDAKVKSIFVSSQLTPRTWGDWLLEALEGNVPFLSLKGF